MHNVERPVFERAHLAWESGDFSGFLDCIADDVIYTVNVDGIAVPYAMSAVGKTDLQDRLQLLLDTFDILKFKVEHMLHTSDFSRSIVHGVYRHKRVGELLDVKVRFVGWERDGRLIRIDEVHDARYVEAFERYMFHMQNATREP